MTSAYRRSAPTSPVYVRPPTECFCGDSAPSKKASNCDKKCAGDDSEFCGGRDAITLYSSGSCPSGGGSAAGAKNIGCYEDDPLDRVLAGRKTVDVKNMNAEVSSTVAATYRVWLLLEGAGSSGALAQYCGLLACFSI